MSIKHGVKEKSILCPISKWIHVFWLHLSNFLQSVSVSPLLAWLKAYRNEWEIKPLVDLSGFKAIFKQLLHICSLLHLRKALFSSILHFALPKDQEFIFALS